MAKDFRDLSKLVYSRDGKPTWNDLNFGVQQRIADALELHNKGIVQAIAEKDELGRKYQAAQAELEKEKRATESYRKWWNNAVARGDRLERSRNGLRGYVGKLQKKLAVK